jgi:hypothetical protein
MRYVRATDPFHRLVTIHPTGIGRLSARNATDDASLLDIDMLQTPHGQREAIPPTVRTVRESYADRPVLPVINGEASYEMLNDRIVADWPRAMFWICMLNGAAGHTYGANGIWQCNRRDQAHGASPHGGNYGQISWDDAMRLPGSTHVALGRRLLEAYDWPRFTPHPEWAGFVPEAPLSLEKSQWVWFPEGNPAQDAPVARRWFRRTFTLPSGQTVARARLFVSADDWFEVRLNGVNLGAEGNWKTGRQFDDVARLLRGGTNVLAIRANNSPANVPANPAGLLAQLDCQSGDGTATTVVSDTSWRCANREMPDWDKPGFDDSGWTAALAVAHYGDGPWGRIGGTSEWHEPQAAGIDNVVRIVWVPRSAPIRVRQLGPQTSWSAAHFDPVSGERKPLGRVVADAAGEWPSDPPAGNTHDWVLVLESAGQGRQ